jgi:hypothetical protein
MAVDVNCHDVSPSRLSQQGVRYDSERRRCTRIQRVERCKCEPKVCLMKLPSLGIHPAEPASFLPFRAIDGGGLLIHPDLFARTDFHLFC